VKCTKQSYIPGTRRTIAVKGDNLISKYLNFNFDKYPGRVSNFCIWKNTSLSCNSGTSCDRKQFDFKILEYPNYLFYNVRQFGLCIYDLKL
jgi:hypothetical protein